jgi:UDP-N-acetylmuramoyl-tripeptide--D-alanyl-D-alanine ligase
VAPQQQTFTAAQIAAACCGKILRGDRRTPVSGISTDTRTLQPGQAFFALVGDNHDGHDFLPHAATAGASVLVVHRELAGWPIPQETAVIRVLDTELALLGLAAWHRRHLSAGVVAVTGSYGKSTVKGMLGTILSQVARCTVAPASYNNRIGVALSLLSATRSDDYVVLELGTNHPGEIDELALVAEPQIGIITAIGEAHLEGLSDLDGVREAKAEMIPHVDPEGLVVLNADDPRCVTLADRFEGAVRTFGLIPGATVRPQRIRATTKGWAFDLLAQRVHVPLGGRYNVMNAAAAICAATSLGIDVEAAATALRTYKPGPLRYERVEMEGILLIQDCYNSNPRALRAAIHSFLMEKVPGRKIVVCGEMLELGDESRHLHAEAGAELAAADVDMLVGVGPMATYTVEAWRKSAPLTRPAIYAETAEEAWQPLRDELQPGDAVLLKGSRGVGLERITERLAACLNMLAKEAAA